VDKADHPKMCIRISFQAPWYEEHELHLYIVHGKQAGAALSKRLTEQEEKFEQQFESTFKLKNQVC
jgi:hypothetical protein